MIKCFLICNNCGNGLYARCDGDVRECTCGNATIKNVNGLVMYKSVDGHVDVTTVEVKQDEFTLIEDFEEMKDRFGLIKDGKKCINTKRAEINPRRYFEHDLDNLVYLMTSA